MKVFVIGANGQIGQHVVNNLQNSNEHTVRAMVRYTIIRPGGLLNEAGTGKISVSENEDRKSIPREDVAKTAIASLNEERTYKQAFDLVSGDKVINEALKAI